MTRTETAAAAFALAGLAGLCGLVANSRAEQRDPRMLSRTAALRAANYAVDAQAVARLAEEFHVLAADRRQPDRWLAHYQAGTASSLLAGFVGPGSLDNPKGDVPLMLRHMAEAAKSFEASIALAPDFPEGHAALANIYGYLAWLDRERAAELGKRAKIARERSLALGPRNPRVVAGHAGFLFWAPPEVGGNRERGLERYREALELFAVEKASDREVHAWGEPDTWAFLAMARLALDRPDASGAKAAVDRALALRSDFRWARGYVLPRIEEALAGAGSPPTAPDGGASPTRLERR